MKTTHLLLIAATLLLLASCGGNKNNESTENIPKKEIPQDREFTPYTIGDEPVNAKNLSEQVQKFYNDLFEKEISVIVAPDFGYIQKGISIEFNERGEREEYGPFRIKRTHDDPVLNLEADYSNQFIVFNGKLWFNPIKGSDFNLLDAYFVGPSERQDSQKSREIAWDGLSVENPVLPGEILQLVSPLNEIEVTITDKVFIDDLKNYVQIQGDPAKGEIYVTCNFADRDELKSVKKDKVYTIKGKFNEINLETGQIWLSDCYLVD